MPRGEAPAWTSTGRPCGDGTQASGPMTLKNLPRWPMAFTFSGSAMTPDSRSRMKASGATLAHSALQTSTNSSIRS